MVLVPVLQHQKNEALLLVVSCGSNDAILRQDSETIVDAHKIKISNAPEQRFETLGLQLFEEVGQDSYLSIEGKLQLPNIPDQFNKDLGCLDVTLDDAAESYFQRVDNFGLRGYNDGGEFRDVSVLACANQCVQDPLCLSFDYGDSICYISYSNRYEHPDAFVAYDNGAYYEWSGTLGSECV